MRVEGVRRTRRVERPRHAERPRVAQQAIVHGVDLGYRYLVLRGDEFGEGSVVSELGGRIEFERAVPQFDLVAMFELLQRPVQLPRAEVTERADDVAPEVDDE